MVTLPMTSDTLEHQAIVERLGQLEARDRRLKGASVTILAGSSVLVLMGQTAALSQLVVAQRFVLKDAKGYMRLDGSHQEEGLELTSGNINRGPGMIIQGGGRQRTPLFRDQLPTSAGLERDVDELLALLVRPPTRKPTCKEQCPRNGAKPRPLRK